MSHFRSSKVFSDASMTIIAIESVEIQHHEMAMDCQFYYGKVEPIAVIVFGSDSHCAFNMNAESISLDQLKQDIPDLEGIILPFSKA